MSVFVRSDQFSDLVFFVKSSENGIRIRDQKFFQDLTASEKVGFEECHVFLKPLSWGKSCELQSQAMGHDPMTNQRIFDSDQYVRKKLLAVIGKWSFVDGDAQVPINEMSVDSLHPAVADFILREYSRRFELSEQDRKNS